MVKGRLKEEVPHVFLPTVDDPKNVRTLNLIGDQEFSQSSLW
jgi:hypothetical protein